SIGGAVGLARLERRRGRLKRELAAIEAIVQRTKDDPPAFEAALAERRARANGLLVDGKIDEAQFAVLKGRLEEVAGQVRLSALDERFHFLPYGMVQTLREMLADGKITRWEREHFVSALERDTMLNAEQKEKVRDLIEGWFQRDAGTGRP
ncbi:MAG TPA: hypothetical protein VI997_04825, partial [Candidatus Thermoplasmatota archaeon]|nr:hypothetical protein [Candidatus Thermoplasmatota archaeon]